MTLEEKVKAALTAVGEKNELKKFAEALLNAVNGTTQADKFKADVRKMRADKEARREQKFSSLNAAIKFNNNDKMLQLAGYITTSSPKDSELVYTKGGKGIDQIKISGNTFTVWKAGKKIQAATPLTKLQEYLNKPVNH